jgi:hypothetical protein
VSSVTPTVDSLSSMVLNETIQKIWRQEAEQLMGPQREELSTVIPMTFVYILIFITGLFGNLCTCIVIIRNKYMHTTVNFYLFSLAVSDLLLLIVGLPPELWGFWQRYPYIFGETFCILRALLSELCSYASVLTITAFTVERYIAICHPLKAHTMAQLPRAVKAILIIWVVSAISSAPIAFQLGIIYQVRHAKNFLGLSFISFLTLELQTFFLNICFLHIVFLESMILHYILFYIFFSQQISNSTGAEMPITGQCALKTRIPYAFLISTIIFFVLPMTLILTLYFLIGLQLRRSSRQMGRTSKSTVSTTISVHTNSHCIHRGGSQHHNQNRVNRDYDSYSSFSHSLNQNSSFVLQDCNDNKHHEKEELEEPKESDRLTPPEVNHHRKNNGKSPPMIKSNSLHLPNLSPNHATTSTSCTQLTPKTGSHGINSMRKGIMSPNKKSPANGATSPVRGDSSPAMLTPTRSRLAIFSSSSPKHQSSSPVHSSPHLKQSHLHHHSRQGSRTFSCNGGTTGGSSYRQHAASRRAVVKMLGESFLKSAFAKKRNNSCGNKSQDLFNRTEVLSPCIC